MLINSDHLSFRILQIVEGDAQGPLAIKALVIVVALVLTAVTVWTMLRRSAR
jgi:hypothetical protein